MRTPGAIAATEPEWDVFIAHAGVDTRDAIALYEALTPGCSTFLDVRSIELGTLWMPQLDAALRSSRVVVVLVTPAFAHAHYLQAEVQISFDRMRKGSAPYRLVPAYLGCRRGDPDLGEYLLYSLQGIVVEDEGGWEAVASRLVDLVDGLKEGSLDPQPMPPPAAWSQVMLAGVPLVGRVLSRLELSRAEALRKRGQPDRLRVLSEAYRRPPPEDEARVAQAALSRGRLRTTATLVAVVLAFGAFLLGLSGALTCDKQLHALPLQAADVVDPLEPSSELVVVFIDDQSERAMARHAPDHGAFGWRWRDLHAELLQRLVDARAHTVAFATAFSQPLDGAEQQRDRAFAGAIRAARRDGTAVIVSATTWRDGQLLVAPAVADALSPDLAGAIAPGGVGVGCWGEKSGQYFMAPLFVNKPGPPEATLPTFPVAAAMAQRRRPLTRFDWVEDFITEVDQDVDDAPGCPVLAPGDRVASGILRLSERRVLRAADASTSDQVLPYEAFWEDECTACASVAGKLVIVGLLRGPEVPVWRAGAGERFTLELLADFTSNLLEGAAVRSLGWFGHFLLLLLFAAITAAARLWLVAGPSKIRRWLVLLVLLLAAPGLAVLLAAEAHVLVDPLCLLLAVAVAWWAAHRFRRLWTE